MDRVWHQTLSLMTLRSFSFAAGHWRVLMGINESYLEVKNSSKVARNWRYDVLDLISEIYLEQCFGLSLINRVLLKGDVTQMTI